MPQISLKLSKNIDIKHIALADVFASIHQELGKVPNMNVNTCNSGMIQEDYSYIGLGDEKVTKVYLEVLWLEDAQRSILKKELAQRLMSILEHKLVPQIEKQGLVCVPRVRIGDLGAIDHDYHISKRASLAGSTP